MINEDSAVTIEVPEYAPLEGYQSNVIKWCDLHWADLMFALKDRGLSEFISPDTETLNMKLAMGDGDPCWESFTRINSAALQIFGPSKLVNEYGGCSICAFSRMVEHVADLVTPKYKDSH